MGNAFRLRDLQTSFGTFACMRIRDDGSARVVDLTKEWAKWTRLIESDGWCLVYCRPTSPKDVKDSCFKVPQMTVAASKLFSRTKVKPRSCSGLTNAGRLRSAGTDTQRKHRRHRRHRRGGAPLCINNLTSGAGLTKGQGPIQISSGVPESRQKTGHLLELLIS